MGKKSKVGKVPFNFKAVEVYIAAGKYQQATLALRRAKVPPKDQKQLAQLQIDAHYLWALDFFKKQQYTPAISTLRMFIERYKKKINLPLEKANMLIGISYLYNHNWEKAIDYLKEAGKDPLTRSFSFYYFLAIIYQKKHAEFSDFLTQYEQEISHLTADQKNYLAIAFALVQGKYTQAQIFLTNYIATTNQDSQSLLALKDLLEEKTPQKTDTSIKGLYKYLLKQPLKTWEEDYLNELPQLKEYGTERKHTKIRTELANSVQQLCEEGMPLSPSVFEACMSLPEEYLPYLVYNQVAALFNEDIEDNESRIVDLLKKYEWHFFKVPESPFLFAQIAYWDSDLFTTNYFWRAIETGLDRFGKSYTKLQLNRLSWRIFACLKYSDYSDKNRANNGYRYVLKLAKKYPAMVGLKLSHLFDYIMLPNIQADSSAFDVFTFGEFQYGSAFALEDFAEAITESSSFRHSAMERFGADMYFHDAEVIQMMDQMEQSIIDKLFIFLKETSIDREVHLKNKSILDFYWISHQLLMVYQTRDIVLSKEQIQLFADGYKKQLELFEVEKDGNKYYPDYEELLEGPLLDD